MARATALAFFDKVQRDPVLRQRVRSMRRRDITALLRIAADLGYLFSARDYQAALEANGELSEEARRHITQGRFIIPGLDEMELSKQ